MRFQHIFIIHRGVDAGRDICELLRIDCNDIRIIEPEEVKENTDQLICMWSKKKHHQQAVISLYETNIKILETIVKEKLNYVLIVEDDAQLIHQDMELDNDCMLHYLNVRTWNDRQISSTANYYPSWQKTSLLLTQLKLYKTIKKNKHRAWDLELDYMKKKWDLNFKYNNYFEHLAYKSTLGNNKYNYSSLL